MSVAPRVGVARFWHEVDSVRERWDPLRHPLHERWAAGELEPGHAKLFASELHHPVSATAGLARRLGDGSTGLLADVLAGRAAGAEEDVGRWMRFARDLGWGPHEAWYFSEDPLASTVDCAAVWACAGGEPSERLMTLHAIDLMLPAVSRGRLCGADPVLTRAALEPLVADREAGLLGLAEGVHRACWDLLDGVLDALPDPRP
jgi:hypothetical protein